MDRGFNWLKLKDLHGAGAEFKENLIFRKKSTSVGLAAINLVCYFLFKKAVSN